MDGNNQSARRRFLQQLGALGAYSTFSLAGQLPFAARVLAAENYTGITDYKSLVCVYLGGGMDSHNAYVPYVPAKYNDYAAIRQSLAIPYGQLKPGADGIIGFHPNADALRSLYDEKKLAIVANLGNLFQPMTPTDLFNYYETGTSTVAIPFELYSHSHQTDLIQLNAIRPPGTTLPGWGGQMADLLVAANVNQSFPLSYTVAGNNYWQSGRSTRPFSVEANDNSIPSFEPFDGESWPPSEPSLSAAWTSTIQRTYGNALEAQAAAMLAGTKQRSDLLRSALAAARTLTTPYDDQNWLAIQLRAIARLISIREQVGMRRQLFFVEIGGWDTHGNQLEWHGDLMKTLSDGLYSFQRTMEEIGASSSVTTFTFSEFNRTLTINGDGTDHAWSGDQLVMGGAVDGGKVHGTRIEYTPTGIGEHWGQTLFGPADTGSGRFVPKYAIDQYGATLAKWMGIKAPDMTAIFPNLNRFTQQDLGFMLA